MLQTLRQWYRRRAFAPYVRPWGISAPIIVLIVCLPLLRPLRSGEISNNESARLATIQALVEHGRQSIDLTLFASTEDRIEVGPDRHYSKQPPVMSFLLAGPYWVMHKLGITFRGNLALSTYMLTLLGATLPVAGAATVAYRMSRLFELSRPWRFGLGLATVFASGLVSYATVLNSHAPAAFLVLSAAGCLFEASIARRSAQARAWMALAGGAAGLAAVIDLGALIFLLLLIGVILAMHWSTGQRILGVIWYLMGALPPLTLHAVLTIPVTGDVLPGFLHGELRVDQRVAATAVESEDDDEEEGRPGPASIAAIHFVDGVLGPRGLLTHFPVILLGVAGIGAVMHRHWPASMKTMALVTLAGAVTVVLAYVTLKADWSEPMFSVRWFILFMPLLVFWAGAWIRKTHAPGIWAAAASMLAFSVITSILGAAAPASMARDGEHTAYAAARYLIRGQSTVEAPRNQRNGREPASASFPARGSRSSRPTAQSGRFGRG